MNEQIAQLQAQVAELLEWKNRRELQLIDSPLDQASRDNIGCYFREGEGSTALTQSYSVTGGGGGSVTAPKAYTSTRFIVAEGERIEVPILNTI